MDIVRKGFGIIVGEGCSPTNSMKRPTIKKPSGFPTTIHHSLFTIHQTPPLPYNIYSKMIVFIVHTPENGLSMRFIDVR